MEFTSTRDSAVKVSPAQAVAQGLSSEGGLFVPTQLSSLPSEAYRDRGYNDIAAAVLSAFFPDFTDLPDLISRAYQEALPVDLHRLDDQTSVLELFHGKSAAFKDVALQFLPLLMTRSLAALGERRKAVVLTATSGDTGSAAMSGFSGVPGTEVIVFYPDEGISQTQRLQMTTQGASNVHAVAIRGNFDAAQRTVKEIFQDRAFADRFADRSFFTSANSINFGRLAPQIVYYFWAYSQLVSAGSVQPGQPVNFTVPTGNFGDILAGFYARQMGLPVGRLACATNANTVLADTLRNGSYDRNRDFFVTSSPSMDILVSSNFERLLYHLELLAGSDSQAAAERVRHEQVDLAQTGRYEIPAPVQALLARDFTAGSLDDAGTSHVIRAVHTDFDYTLDPHSAVAYGVMDQLRAAGQLGGYNVVLSTASPYKFPATVEAATGRALPPEAAPANLRDLEQRPVTQTAVIDPAEAREEITRILSH